jgi:hypothetical protein
VVVELLGALVVELLGAAKRPLRARGRPPPVALVIELLGAGQEAAPGPRWWS